MDAKYIMYIQTLRNHDKGSVIFDFPDPYITFTEVTTHPSSIQAHESNLLGPKGPSV